MIEEKNKSLQWVVLVITIIVVAVGCFFSYKALSNKDNGEKGKEEEKEVEKIAPLLYEVTREGTDNKMYLFGSIHATASGDLKLLPDYVLNAYNNSHYLACEYDGVAQQSDQERVISDAMKMLYQDGTTIKDHLSEETYNKLVNFLTEKKSYVNVYEQYKPVFFVSLIANLLATDAKLKAGSVDEYFENKAHADNKKILEVESYDYQLTVFDGFSDSFYDLMIRDEIDTYDNSVSDLLNLYNAWKTGNAEDLVKYGSDEMKEKDSYTSEQIKDIEKFNNTLIVLRNKEMTDKAIEYFNNNQDVFFMVGALHIVGDTGLAKSLQEKGFTVTQVK